jgi:probable phosphoglycerate mutase
VSSPLSRAQCTARPSAAAAAVAPTVDERLVEVDFGAGDGLTRAEMAERFPDALTAFLAAPSSSPLPGGERGPDAVARARAAIADLVAAWPAGRVLVVAHQTLLRLLLCAEIGVSLDCYRALFPRLDPVALSELRVTPDARPALLRLNAPM